MTFQAHFSCNIILFEYNVAMKFCNKLQNGQERKKILLLVTIEIKYSRRSRLTLPPHLANLYPIHNGIALDIFRLTIFFLNKCDL